MALDHNQISDYRRRRGSGFRGRQTQRQAGRFGCGITVGDDSGADLVARRNALDRKSGESRLVYVLVRGADTSDVFNISDVAAPNRLLAYAVSLYFGDRSLFLAIFVTGWAAWH